MLPGLIAAIQRYSLFTQGARIAVAVSGGADSVCLLHLLHELAPAWDLSLTVLHLDHNLRGDESRADAEFVRQLAARLNLPFLLRAANPGAEPGNLEQTSRRARLAFFREILETNAADRVATAHTRSDQAETVLYRFLRGSGTAGLAAIRPYAAPGIIRPLLDIDRGDVEHYLRTRGIPWREDSTNADPRFDRNRIRHQLLPLLAREWNPAISLALAQTADWARAEEEFWAAEIARLARETVRETTDGVILKIQPVLALPLAVRRRMVRHAIERAKGDLRGIDFPHVESVLAMAALRKGHGRLHLPGLDVIRSFDWVRFALPAPAAPQYQASLKIPGMLHLPGPGIRFSLELIENRGSSDTPASVYNKDVGCLDWGRLSGLLQCRYWRPGDRYQPIASASVQKIKTLFQQARIPLWERRNWPILLDGDSIVWVRRFGPAAQFAAGPGTATILRIQEVEP